MTEREQPQPEPQPESEPDDWEDEDWEKVVPPEAEGDEREPQDGLSGALGDDPGIGTKG